MSDSKPLDELTQQLHVEIKTGERKVPSPLIHHKAGTVGWIYPPSTVDGIKGLKVYYVFHSNSTNYR